MNIYLDKVKNKKEGESYVPEPKRKLAARVAHEPDVAVREGWGLGLGAGWN